MNFKVTFTAPYSAIRGVSSTILTGISSRNMHFVVIEHPI